MFNIVKIFSGKNLKIARENLTIDEPEGQQHEWRRLVGSIRRRVQRHGTNTSHEPGTSSKAQTPSPTLPRKNSLTQSRFDFFKREKSRDEAASSDGASSKDPSHKNEKKETQKQLTKQKSIEPKGELFKGLSFKDKSKSCSVKNVNALPSPTISAKGSRKSEKMKEGVEKKVTIKTSLNKSKSAQKAAKNRDDFLKATMRIFLVVSPPVGKMQVMFTSVCTFIHLCMLFSS